MASKVGQLTVTSLIFNISIDILLECDESLTKQRLKNLHTTSGDRAIGAGGRATCKIALIGFVPLNKTPNDHRPMVSDRTRQ
jgi:hypothetical protein